jgi:hypothetical protein
LLLRSTAALPNVHFESCDQYDKQTTLMGYSGAEIKIPKLLNCNRILLSIFNTVKYTEPDRTVIKGMD